MEKRLERKKYNDLFIDDMIVCVEILKEDMHICTHTQTRTYAHTHKQTIDTTHNKLDGSKRNYVEWKIESQKIM